MLVSSFDMDNSFIIYDLCHDVHRVWTLILKLHSCAGEVTILATFMETGWEFYSCLPPLSFRSHSRVNMICFVVNCEKLQLSPTPSFILKPLLMQDNLALHSVHCVVSKVIWWNKFARINYCFLLSSLTLRTVTISHF